VRTYALRATHLEAKTSGFCRGRRAAEQAFRAQVFIDVRPVNPIACSANFPARSLFHGSAQKPGIPRQGNDDCPPVREVHRQRVISHVYVSYAFSGIKMGSVHAISPTRDCDSLTPAGGLAEAPPDRCQGFWPAQPGPTRTSPTDHRDPREHGEARWAHDCENTCGATSTVGTPFSISPPCGGFPLHCCQSAAGRGAGRGKEASNTLLYTGRQERVYCRTSGSGPPDRPKLVMATAPAAEWALGTDSRAAWSECLAGYTEARQPGKRFTLNHGRSRSRFSLRRPRVSALARFLGSCRHHAGPRN